MRTKQVSIALAAITLAALSPAAGIAQDAGGGTTGTEQQDNGNDFPWGLLGLLGLAGLLGRKRDDNRTTRT